MNRALRQWHFRLMAALAPAAALTFAASILAREAIPENPVTAHPRATPSARAREVAHGTVRGDGVALEVRRVADPWGGNFLELRPLRRMQSADLLVYLGPGGSDSFPGNARLLGPLSGAGPATFALPGDGAAGFTDLFLYSGATRTILAHVNLTGLGEVAP